jgi:triosephosphate isomerase
MTSEIRPLIAGNWKMNGTVADLREAQALAQALDGAPAPADVALCPPATLIAQMVWALRGSDIAVGGQDCHAKASGAFTGDVSAEMLADAAFAVAYEPRWAIGTGLTPTPDQIAEVHGLIRTVLVKRFGAGGAKAPILYGGSVKPDNAAEILHIPDVGGALVGGASLKAEEFLQIIRAL